MNQSRLVSLIETLVNTGVVLGGEFLRVEVADEATRLLVEEAAGEAGIRVIVRVAGVREVDLNHLQGLPDPVELDQRYVPEVQRTYSGYLPPVKGKRGRVRRW